MVVYYGLNRKVKLKKNMGVMQCTNCGHQVEAQLAKIGGYAHLYHIPVFPYAGPKFILCPKCGIMKPLTGAEYKAILKG